MAAKKVGYANYRTAHLTKITSAAKALRKKKPLMKWTEAVKQASKNIAAGKKVSGVKKASKTAAKPAKKIAVKVSVKGASNPRTIRANESIEQLKKYGEFVKQELQAQKELQFLKNELRRAKNANPGEKLALIRMIKVYDLTLKAVRKQKAIQKTLI